MMDNKMEENKFVNMTFAQLNQEEVDYYNRNGKPTELDMSINQISQAKIIAYHREHGVCYMGKIYPENVDPDKPKIKLTKHTGQKIHTFEYEFILPVEDQQIIAMLNALNKKPDYEHPCVRISLRSRLYERISKVGGKWLAWA